MDEKGTVEKESDSPPDIADVKWECPFCQDAIYIYHHKEELVKHLRYFELEHQTY